MSDPTDEQREQEIRARVRSNSPWNTEITPFLLRLLDAERARADAAEQHRNRIAENYDLVHADWERENTKADAEHEFALGVQAGVEFWKSRADAAEAKVRAAWQEGYDAGGDDEVLRRRYGTTKNPYLATSEAQS